MQKTGNNEMGFKAISASRRSNKIITQICEAIATGRLKVGDKLPSQRQMVLEFKCSLRTVREALQALETMGHIETRLGAKGGTFITKIGAKEYQNEVENIILHSDISAKDLIEFREAIEGLAAMIAAKKIEPDQIEQLTYQLKTFKMAMDRDEFTFDQVFPWDMEMHQKLAEISGNVLLEANVKLFHDKMKQQLPGTMPIDKSLVADCLDDWEQIIDALEKGQADKLSSYVRVHIRKFSEFFFQGGEKLRRYVSSSSNQTTDQRTAISESNQEAILLFAGADLSANTKSLCYAPKVKEWHFPSLTWWTGKWGALGEEAKFGINTAVEEINAGGGIRGIPVRLTWYDTGYDAERTRSHFKRILLRKPLIILGPQCDVTISVACPLAAKEGVFIISGASDNVPFIDTYPWGTALLTTIEGLTRAAAEFWYNLHGKDVKSVGLFPTTISLAVQRQAHTWRITLEEKGLTVLPNFEVPPETKDFVQIVERALNLDTDAFVNLNLPEQGARLAIELHQRGVREGWRLVHYPCTDLPPLYQIGKGFLEDNYVYNLIDINHKDEKWSRLLEKYRQWRRDTEVRPSYLVPFAFDIPFIIRQTFEDLKITGDPAKLREERIKIRDYILNLRNFQGVQGPISVVKGTGGAERPIFYYKISNNQPKLISAVPSEMILP